MIRLLALSFIALCILTRLTWAILRWYLYKHYSGIPDIEKLDKARPGQRLDGTAVICGGSIAGLLAARVCHDFFERVIIVEPEEWLTSEDGMRRFGREQEHKRSRVMQYQSLHGCQALLYKGLEKLFPDLEEQCRYSGIPIFPADRKSSFAGTLTIVPLKSYNGSLPNTLYCGRAGMETLIRRVLSSDIFLGRGNYPRIEQITGTVTGIIPDDDSGGSISKVTVRGTDLQLRNLDAALVVDCTGVTRAGMKWLSHSGFGKSGSEPCPDGKVLLQDAKISFDQKLNYSTLVCDVPSSILKKLPFPPNYNPETAQYMFLEDEQDKGRRMFVLMRLEGNGLLLFCGQSSDKQTKYESLDAFRSMLHEVIPFKDPVPDWVFQIIDILEESEVVFNYSHLRVPGSTYIRYHKTVNLPNNFTALGDSVSSVDPLYGQGCTKVMLGAVALHNALSTGLIPGSKKLPLSFGQRFFKEHYKKTDIFWQTTRLIDYGIPCTEPLPGEDLASGQLVRWYLRRLQILATKDEQAARVFWDGAMAIGTAIDPFHPWLMIKIFWSAVIGE
ncbi:hypothetical protein BDP27DRAFT_1428556 [Rhodocollybia butyracea]|uniref:Uncharacterized protein n=1 Tax=Rhodocollybia butyracea TaxID=206335 RepID=A0A9P5U0X6_9AGAR|nr:hypothetical protein BDP27DRAFT_1428556 [Rhodocollybia butyracea]